MQQNAEVEECLKRILSQERVSRYIIFNKDGRRQPNIPAIYYELVTFPFGSKLLKS